MSSASGSSSEILVVARIEPGDADAVMDASHLFDGPASPEFWSDFSGRAGHHLLIAYVDSAPAGFITGIEIAHPDKQVEMLAYELGVDEPFRRKGIARALLAALSELAVERGCRGLWVTTEPDNDAAIATYRSLGRSSGESINVNEESTVTFSWGT